MADATACPVAALAREAKALTAAQDRNEEARGGLTPAARISLEREDEVVAARRWTAEERACQLRATSAEGALFQVALAASAASLLHDHADPRFAQATDEFARRVAGALYSAAAFLEREAGLRREEVFGDWYLSDYLDPHAAVEKALAATG